MRILRNGSELIDVQVNNQTQYKHILGSKKFIKASFVFSEYVRFQIDDYVNWRGEQFAIYSEPSVNKLKTNEFRYDIEFQSSEYKFLNTLYLFDNQGEFYLMGDLEKFANLIVENLNRVAGAGAYELESVPDTAVKNLNFSNMNCLNALQYLATEFDVEYTIHSTGPIKIKIENRIGNETGLVFEYKYGLRNITRKKIANADLVTRLYPYGGERNITHDYGNKRLKITPLYLENNIGLFGTIEGVVNFDDIYPRRLGTLSGVDSDELKFTDSSIDFNVNDQLIAGVTAKLTFNSGSLEGYEFELQSFNNTSKLFTLIPFEDENGLVLPNPTLRPAVGDTYVLHDITMPQSYITNAETELQTKAQEYLDENSTPNIIYEVAPDHIYLRQHLIELSVGDIIQIHDKDLEADFDTRILEISQSIADPYLYTFKIGTKVSVAYLARTLAAQLDARNKIDIERFDRTLKYNQVRRSFKNIDELKGSIYDTDDYFDTDNIRPLSIESSMLSVGNKSQQFIIRNLLIEANYQSDVTKVNCGEGVLVHFTIADAIKEWNLSASLKTLTDNNQFYYIFAKCDKSGNTGVFEITATQHSAESTDYYYFLIGVVHSVVDDVRGISLTYGQTTINGGFVRTGKIQSTDGQNYFDLDGNKFRIGDADNSMDWNVTEADTLTLRGSFLQDLRGPAGSDGADGQNGTDGATGPSIVFRGEFNASTIYYNNANRRDVVKYNDIYYIYNGTNGVALQWAAANWDNFGAQFDSVATDLLLAEQANIADWIIKNGKISSQNTYNGNPRAILNGEDGSMEFVSPRTIYTSSGGDEDVEQTIEISSVNGRIEARHDSSANQSAGVSRLDSDGIFANFAGQQALPASTGIEVKGAIVGLGFGKLGNGAFGSQDALCGVFGRAYNSETSNPAPTYGGYFMGLKANGFFLNVETVSSSTTSFTIGGFDDYISCYNTNTASIYLPTTNRYSGRLIYVKRINGGVYVYGNGANLMLHTQYTDIGVGHGDVWMFVWDGSYWCAQKLVR